MICAKFPIAIFFHLCTLMNIYVQVIAIMRDNANALIERDEKLEELVKRSCKWCLVRDLRAKGKIK